MERFQSTLKFKRIELDDARSIVQHSFIVQNSVSHLDLSTCEFSLYQKQIRKTPTSSETRISTSFIQTDEACRKFFIKERQLLYALHLDLQEMLEPRLRNSNWYSARWWRVIELRNEAKCGSNKFYLSRIIISHQWRKRTARECLVPFLKLTNHKIDSIRKLDPYIFCCGLGLELREPPLYYFESSYILCLEIKECDNLRGILIIVDNHERFTVSTEADTLLFQTYCIEGGLQNTVHFDSNIINRLLQRRTYQFLPTALMYGVAPRFLWDDIESAISIITWYRNYPPEQLTESVNEGVMSVRRNCLLLLNLLPLLQSDEVMDYEEHENGEAARQSARHVLNIMWSAIPDPFFSKKEVEYAFKHVLEEDFFNRFNDFYEEIVEEYPLNPTPRSLKHLSRMVIRMSLRDSGFLPEGIGSLDIPQKLCSYLRLGL